MKTILYFQSSLAASNMRELEGVRKYAADEGWKVQVIEYDGAAKSRYETAGGILPDVKGLVSLYRPNGCIVECGGRRPKFEKEEFGRVPVVLLDCHPDDAWRGALCVYMDGDPTKAGNWSGTEGCGSLTDTGNRDNATFRGAPSVTTIVPSQEWIIGSFFFSSYNNQAAQWQIGSGNPDAAPIRLAGIGSGSLDFSHGEGITEFVVDLSGPFVVSNDYQFSCNSTERIRTASRSSRQPFALIVPACSNARKAGQSPLSAPSIRTTGL